MTEGLSSFQETFLEPRLAHQGKERRGRRRTWQLPSLADGTKREQGTGRLGITRRKPPARPGGDVRRQMHRTATRSPRRHDAHPEVRRGPARQPPCGRRCDGPPRPAGDAGPVGPAPSPFRGGFSPGQPPPQGHAPSQDNEDSKTEQCGEIEARFSFK